MIKFDVIKPVSEYKKKELCPFCETQASRVFTAPHFSVDKTQAEYNPAIGKVIKNKRHLKYEVDKRGLIEVGNEKPKKIHSEMEATRKHKRQQRYEQAMKEVQNNEY